MTEEKNTLAILTLERHQKGIWIERLIECLQQQVVAAPNKQPTIQIRVVVLEDFLHGPVCVSSLEPPPPPRGDAGTANNNEHRYYYHHHHGWESSIESRMPPNPTK